MDAQAQRLVQLGFRELASNVRAWLLIGIIVSAVAITAAFKLPKQYTSYASILVEQQRVVGNLMEGAAEQTDAGDQASIVRELASSRRLLESMLEQGGWLKETTSLVEQEREMEEIKSRTEIDNRGGDLIGIRYTDTVPQRAYELTQMYVDWVIAESRSSKKKESMEAYEFIDSQVEEYHSKLKAAEQGLKLFRSENLDSLPESATEVVNRATSLRRQMETMQLELSELEVRERSLQKQISGEATVSNVRAEEAAYRVRIAALDQELDTMRLSYQDSYPDIVRLKNQIAELRQQMKAVASGQVSSDYQHGSPAGGDQAGNTGRALNSLYESLRSELAATHTQIETNEARMIAMRQLLQQEVERSGRIANAEAAMSELTRDYEVNEDIYQDLLRRRENARLSMNLDSEQQGVTMKVQEPPAVPVTPSGIRFIHVLAAGVLMILAIPIALSALIVQFDPRVRMKHRIEEMGLPVLAVVPQMETSAPWRQRLRAASLAFCGLALVAMYGGAIWFKLQGQV